MRKIPATMATQHPDNASAPFWDGDKPFVSAYQEIGEAVACFKELGVSEYMWDWEGKHADAAVIDRLLSDHYDYFKSEQLGRDKFLTFRIPNIWEEKGYNLLQAMTVILSSEDFARDLKLPNPLFEVILPMTERADQLQHMQSLFQKLAHFKSTDFTADRPANNDRLELIPLVENVESQLAVADLLKDYVATHKQQFGQAPQYIRAFLACSDSALSSGHLARVIGNKVGLTRLYEFSEQSGIPVFPIAGAGSLPFRGGLTPDRVDEFAASMPGVRTVTIQSAFRYDFPKAEVKDAVAKLEATLPKTKPPTISQADQAQLIEIAELAAKLYKDSLQKIAASMQPIFAAVPKRRDRRQHIGLVGYGRSMGGQTLPRAITFTGAFYSIGVPPEFIGLGRTLSQLKPAQLAILKQHYPQITDDVERAGRYLNQDNLDEFAAGSPDWQAIKEDVQTAAELLGIKLGPQSADELKHRKLSTEAITLKDQKALTELIDQMAVLRSSLG